MKLRHIFIFQQFYLSGGFCLINDQFNSATALERRSLISSVEFVSLLFYIDKEIEGTRKT